jgi:hypothetical protein
LCVRLSGGIDSAGAGERTRADAVAPTPVRVEAMFLDIEQAFCAMRAP